MNEHETLYVILKAILLRNDYQKYYKKHIEAKEKGKDFISYKWWWKILSTWGISDPIDPSTDVRKISPELLKIYFLRGGVLLSTKTHRQLAGKDKVPSVVEVSIDLTQNKTRILREMKAFIEKMQVVRKTQEDITLQKPHSERKSILNYSLSDFDIYKQCLERKNANGHIPFHRIARMKLGKNEISTDIDLEAKKIKNAYERAKWLINGGYKTLLKSETE